MIYDEVDRLADEAIRLNVRAAENAILLTVAVNYACMDAWVRGYRQARVALDGRLEKQARTNRLIRRGVPAEAAARALWVV